MHQFQPVLEHHTLLLVFITVFLEQAGLPIPAMPLLIVAGALSVRQDIAPISMLLAVAVAACVLTDTGWYVAGAKLGRPLLRKICQLSLTQDTCIRETENLYLNVGPRCLAVAKLLPGVGTLSVTMAGLVRTPYLLFLRYDLVGSLLWAGVGLGIGALFNQAVDRVLATMAQYGRMGLLVGVMALVLFIGWKLWKRMSLLRRTGRVPRVSAQELQKLAAANPPPVIVDVRPDETGLPERIEGAVHVAFNAPLDSLKEAWTDREIVIYCTCPHEVSAALLAQRFINAGFPKVAALSGGLDAWRRLEPD